MFEKIKNCKKLILLFSVVLLLTGVTGTYMWAMHEISVENILQSRTVDVLIEEKFDGGSTTGTVSKDVNFTNTGTASVFLRFTYAQYWETDSELLEGYSNSTTLNWLTDLTDENSSWFYYDGWYYYEYVVSAQDRVAILESVTFSDNVPTNANYKLFFQVETVQVSDENSVNQSATTQAFGVPGTVSETTIVDGAVTSGTVTWVGDDND